MSHIFPIWLQHLEGCVQNEPDKVPNFALRRGGHGNIGQIPEHVVHFGSIGNHLVQRLHTVSQNDLKKKRDLVTISQGRV